MILGVTKMNSSALFDVSDFDLTEFTRTGELAAQGEKAALGSVDEIKKLLTQLDKDLFPAS